MAERAKSRRNPSGHYTRRSKAGRRVGIGASCACGENRPAALIADSEPTTCRRCTRIIEEATTLDKHHVAGRANDATTLKIPTNDHVAMLSEDQHDWPLRTLENPDGDPALRGAACLRGFISTLHYLIDSTLGWLAGFLEGLSAWLVRNVGRFWWHGTPLAAFAPGR